MYRLFTTYVCMHFSKLFGFSVFFCCVFVSFLIWCHPESFHHLRTHDHDRLYRKHPDSLPADMAGSSSMPADLMRVAGMISPPPTSGGSSPPHAIISALSTIPTSLVVTPSPPSTVPWEESSLNLTAGTWKIRESALVRPNNNCLRANKHWFRSNALMIDTYLSRV